MTMDLTGYKPIWNEGFNAYVGPFMYRDGHAVLELRDEHMNGGNFAHGGLMMAFVDAAIAKTGSDATGDAHCVTMSLNTDFIAAGQPGTPIEARAEITRQTRSIIFATGRVTQGDQTLLTASAILKIIRPPA